VSTTFYVCERDGCQLPADAYSLPDEDEPSYYCGGHARQEGFCVGCGHFCAGIESFDFSRSGLCDQCEDELGDDDDDDEEDWMDDDIEL
jgi:hypothetical protein